jgi:Resolvase, N terminal domain
MSNLVLGIQRKNALYARYSSRFQHSIEDQIRVCKDWAEKNGIEVPDDLNVIDRAATGKTNIPAPRCSAATGSFFWGAIS